MSESKPKPSEPRSASIRIRRKTILPRVHPEETILFDTYHEFCFLFVLTRDNWEVHHQPERFRVATEEEIRKYPVG